MPSAKNLNTDNIKKLILYNLNLKAQSDAPEDNEVQTEAFSQCHGTDPPKQG